MQHAGCEVETKVFTKLLQDTGGIQQQLTRIENCGSLSLRKQVCVQSVLLFQTGVGKPCIRYLYGQGWQHFLWVTNQEDIAGLLQKTEINVHQVVRHVLDEKSR